MLPKVSGKATLAANDNATPTKRRIIIFLSWIAFLASLVSVFYWIIT